MKVSPLVNMARLPQTEKKLEEMFDQDYLSVREKSSLYRIMNEAYMALGTGALDDLPPTVWHYTTAPALMSIIKTQELYATETSCLNDATEISHFIEILRTAINDYEIDLTHPSLGNHIILREMMDRALDDAHASPLDTFVSCFSCVQDDLSQWRSYGGGENGFALGFDRKALEETSEAAFFQVNYDTGLQRTIADILIEKGNSIFDKIIELRKPSAPSDISKAFIKNFADYLVSESTMLAATVKNSAFGQEQEVRLAKQVHRSEKADKIVILARPSFLSRHFRLCFSRDGHKLPLSEVIVGPSRYQNVSTVTVRRLLDVNGFKDTKVSVSAIPYRAT